MERNNKRDRILINIALEINLKMASSEDGLIAKFRTAQSPFGPMVRLKVYHR